MLPNITLKHAGIGAAVLTGITGTTLGIGYGTGSFTSTPKPQTQKINKLLNDQNKYTLLSTNPRDDKEAWNAAWKKYKENGQNKWNIQGFEQANVNNVPLGFKDACTNRKTGEVIDINDSSYTDFVKYCTRPKTVQEALRKFGFRPLEAHETYLWTQKFQKYKESKNKLPNANSVDSNKTYEYLKQGCTGALQKKTTDNDYEQTAEATKEWCGK